MRPRSTTVNRQAFPVDEWALVQVGEGMSEDAHDTVFAVSNGVFGLRTPIGHGQSGARSTMIVNRFYETFEITYPEDAFGLARSGQSLIPGPDVSQVEIEINEVRYELNDAQWVRRLDFTSGSLRTVFRLPLAGGAAAVITRTAFVSQVRQQHAFQRWTVEIENSELPHTVSISIHVRHVVNDLSPAQEHDPRQGRQFTGDDAPICEIATIPGGLVSHITTRKSQQHLLTTLRSPADDCIATTHPTGTATGLLTLRGVASSQKPYEASTVLKVATSAADGRHGSLEDDHQHDGEPLPEFESALREHQQAVSDFWSRADVSVTGDPAIQQALRWHLFQLFQASPTIDGIGISAKGQTALGYDGHYFWDTEIFMLPFLCHALPDRARRALEVRHNMLPNARSRATMLSQQGALFPWRTLSGEEASAYYPAGTAQYHINADIAWAVDRYLLVADDQDFAITAGADLAIETARMWADFAFKGDDGQWHIHGVTGPDEYSAVVDDNAYTNAMAARNLRLAARIATDSAQTSQKVSADELSSWIRIADGLTIPFDDDRGIYAQDAHFLSRQRWELSEIPEHHYPLLLHLHPLVIYRYQLTKQADVVLAMLLAPEAFDRGALRDTFLYYEGVTTGDSSLSAAIQAAAAASVDEKNRADEHFNQALFLDLANTHGNTADGVHLANCGGIWNAIIFGMAGLSFEVDGIKIAPTGWCVGDEVSVLLHVRSSLLELKIRRDGTSVQLKAGKPIQLLTPHEAISVHETPLFVPAVFPSAFQRG